MYIYAHINKNTLRFVREQKAISFDYVTRITKFKEDKLTLWESNDSGKFPTIKSSKDYCKVLPHSICRVIYERARY